jgi:hypothetical protein
MGLQHFILYGIIAGLFVKDIFSIPTTLEGPYAPVTVPLDPTLRKGSQDLPAYDPRLVKRVPSIFPEQIMLALSTDHQSMWVSWVTGDAQIGPKVTPLDPSSVGTEVNYGTKSGHYSFTANGTSVIYSQTYTEKGHLNYTSGIIHHVLLTGLLPSTRYYYICGDTTLSAISEEHQFMTPPSPGPTNYLPRIAVVGDLGLTYNSSTTIDHLVQNDPSMILMVGDMSYATNYNTTGFSHPHAPVHQTYQPRWDAWGRFMEPLVSHVPMMVLGGNHEKETQGGGVKFASYNARFAVPSKESGSDNNLYYSFNAGGVHFVILASYTHYKRTSEQYRWLERDLKQVDRSVTPWLIASWHSPWYNSYKSHYQELECMRQEMEDLLYKYGVDIAFHGHVHAYERMNRVYKYGLDPCGPVYITIGDGGNIERLATHHADQPGMCPKTTSVKCPFNYTSGPAKGNFCWDKQPEWSAYRESSFGHGTLEVKNSTHALWTWHRNQDAYESVGDQIYIVRDYKNCSLYWAKDSNNQDECESATEQICRVGDYEM